MRTNHRNTAFLQKTVLQVERNLTSPAVQYACAAAKIDPTHLKAFSEPRDSRVTEEVRKVRIQHHELRRHQKIRQVAEFMVNNNLTPSRRRNESFRPKSTEKAEMYTIETLSNSQLDSEKRKIERLARVKQNLSKLKVVHEKRRNEMVKLQLSKLNRQKPVSVDTMNSERRDATTRKALEKKYREIRDRETKALNRSFYLTEARSVTRSETSSRHRPIVLNNTPDHTDIESKLDNIKQRFIKSHEIHNKWIADRKARLVSKTCYEQSTLNTSPDDNVYFQVKHLHDSILKSNRRRSEIIESKVNKLAQANQSVEFKRQREAEKEERKRNKMDRNNAAKDKEIQEKRRDAGDIIKNKQMVIHEKYHLKKIDQESNMAHKKEQEYKNKMKLLEIIREKDEKYHKLKTDREKLRLAKENLMAELNKLHTK